MAADVCTEQLPSASYANTISSSSTTLASQKANKIATSFSIAFFGSHYMSQSTSSTVINHNHQEDVERVDSTTTFAISSLPSEIHLHILKHLPRHNIDSCKFVCKRWKEIIDHNRHSLRKHLVETLELREQKSQFILTLNCPDFTKHWTFCERAENHRNLAEHGKRRRTKTTMLPEVDGRLLHHQEQEQQQQSEEKLSNVLIYVGHRTLPGSYLPILLPTILRDSTESMEEHDKRKRREHTPPKIVCERIAKYFHEADVHCLRFTEMRFTDCFVDHLLDAFETRKIQCKKVEISLCKLAYVTPAKFYQLLQLFECEKISLVWLRGNDGHLSNSRQILSAFLRLRYLKIAALTPEVIIGDDQFLADFLENKAMKYSEKTVLQLDCCSITTTGLCQAIEKWRQVDRQWILNFCLLSKQINFDNLLRYFSLDQTKPGQTGAFLLVHPQQLGEALLLWNDNDGVHVASSKNLNS